MTISEHPECFGSGLGFPVPNKSSFVPEDFISRILHNHSQFNILHNHPRTQAIGPAGNRAVGIDQRAEVELR